MNQEAWQKVETAIAATKDTTIKQLFAADPDRAAKYALSAAGRSLPPMPMFTTYLMRLPV